ncbi:calcium-binding protein [Microtetraspora sp. NBRC 13810]|uniref:EF-hand domain-containing protein n=1 Tax=Microtetraspora sp. NBRC 13810 TaxID=3030990 RepID=UPI0024A2F12B|nr:EF-hand domain-containing protein [Microtetraspora sp. NBRC 13810]GLW12456.1 calcium-binding protein [Microtetraspora sp. NBRC 13810]
MADFLEQKLRHFFGLMDRDGSDTLEVEDYLHAADRVSESFGFASGSVEHKAVGDSLIGFWRHVVAPADLDGDGHVTFEEYAAAYRQGIAADGYARIEPIGDAIISIADTDGDGKVTQEEFVRAISGGFGVPAEQCAAAFTSLDTGAKGHLTRAELQRATAEYFLGDDPAAPGNSLFGRF